MDIQQVFEFFDNDVMVTSIIVHVKMVLTGWVSLLAVELKIVLAKCLQRQCVAWQQKDCIHVGGTK